MENIDKASFDLLQEYVSNGGTVLQIGSSHELIDGELETDHCGHNKEDCPFDICVYGSVREEMLEKFKQFFSNKKLSDINKKTE